MKKDITSVMGYQQITSLSAATGLTVPNTTLDGQSGTPTVAFIRVDAQSVRFRDDGVAPTASVGFPLVPGDVLEYDGDLKKIQFIEQVAGAVLNVVYYK
jgi:hypothetical protein